MKESYSNILESVCSDNADVMTEWGQGSRKQSQFPRSLQDSFIEGLFELRVRSIPDIYHVYQK